MNTIQTDLIQNLQCTCNLMVSQEIRLLFARSVEVEEFALEKHLLK
jgi:hypothetical protein